MENLTNDENEKYYYNKNKESKKLKIFFYISLFFGLLFFSFMVLSLSLKLQIFNVFTVIFLVSFIGMLGVTCYYNALGNTTKKTSISLPAKEINKYVIEMLNDKRLVQFSQKFCLDKALPGIHDISFSFLPIYYSQYTYEYKMKYKTVENSTSCYLKTLNTYTKDYIKQSQYTIAPVYLCINKEFEGHYKIGENGSLRRLESFSSEPYRKLWDIFYALQNKGILKDNDNIYYFQAFCFLLYYQKLNIYSNDNIEELNSLGLSSSDTDVDIIKRLYEEDYDEKDIFSVLCINNVTKQDCCCAIKIKDENLENLISNEIKQLENSNIIDRYMSDNNLYESRIEIGDVDLMSGEEFECFIAELFEKMKYKTEITKTTGDQGIDIIAIKGKSKVAIQTKCYSGTVGNHAIMEAVAGAKFYNATQCMVITNSTFTKSARELAVANNVILWDRKILKEKIDEN